MSNYSSRTVSFSAHQSFGSQRQVTGLEGPSTTAMFGQSFPQPDEVEDETGDGRDNQEGDVQTEELAPVGTDDLAKVPQILGIEDPDNPPQPKSIPVSSDHGMLGDTSNRGVSARRREESSSAGQQTFVTAHESMSGRSSPEHERNKSKPVDVPSDLDLRGSTSLESQGGQISSPYSGPIPQSPGAAGSTTSLIPHTESEGKSKMSKASRKSLRQSEPAPMADDARNKSVSDRRMVLPPGGVRFVDNVAAAGDQMAKRFSQAQQRTSGFQFRRNLLREGAVVKTEKMLVRLDTTLQDVPPDFDENDRQKMDTQLLEKWREYMVVVRQSHDDDSDFRLQLYKTRVIPIIEDGHVKRRCHHEIRLNPKNTRVNLFSSLDKTVVLWHPYRKGTRFFVMRPRAVAHSVEWYTFLRNILGWARPPVLVVNVPDLSLTLRLENPFQELEAARDSVQNGEEGEEIIKRTMEEEQAVAGRIITRCLNILEGSPEWADVLDAWTKNSKMGLAWKRYDRLEWVHGSNEQKMYGSMAMTRTHELELRPKQHYSTTIVGKKGKVHEEPPPIEGFLIRLTSQRGVHQRLGKMFFKRLYFTTQNQYLIFCRPSRTTPPHPPRLTTIGGSNVPSASEIATHTPMMYDIDPYPLENGEISWLKSGNRAFVRRHDQEAYAEAQRNIDNLTKCDGYINMTRIIRIRNVKWGATPVDEDLEEGEDVDFHQDVTDSNQDDGTTDQIDDERIFELVLDNGLVIRLQAYSGETKAVWIKRLRGLVKYWKLRIGAELNTFKMVRQTNLERLNIDEEMEAIVGQFARKWEVSKSEASPQLYHMCGIGCCRPITISGLLYRKPRRHSTFLRCGVILTNGKLLIFQASLRHRSGKEIPHIHQEHQHTLDLQDCYVYSGLITEDDLLYQNQTFDSNHPGLHALPRVYLEDGWTSRDQDSMSCFVLWHGLKKSFFRTQEEQEGGTTNRLRQVSRLGVPGRSMVFKCRSRAERDHWVMSIGMEIDRLQQGEDVRLEPTKEQH